MKNTLYSLRDQKVGIYNQPFTAPTPESIIRQLKKDVEQQRGDVGTYPEDFDLFEIGYFDNESAQFQSLNSPKHIISCLTLKNMLANPSNPENTN